MDVLRAHDIVVRRHPSRPPVLRGVSFSVAQEQIVAVVGSNGSGKSTLARVITGLITPESGRIDGGEDHKPAPRVGLVLQDPAAQVIMATVADEIAVGVSSGPVAQRVDAVVTEHELDNIWHRDPLGLSGGQQQRVALAAIDACDVDVLVLDEPTAMLDVAARASFSSRIRARARGRAVLWITQEPEEIALCDRVMVLHAGALAWNGSVQEYVSDPDLARTWGLEIPAASRIVHDLKQLGVWPQKLSSRQHPTTVPELLAQLGIGGSGLSV